MNTAVINIKTEAEVKRQSQKIAKEMGISLSGLINGFLKQLVRTKRVEFTLDETPNAYLRGVMKRAEKNYKTDKTSPIFTDNQKLIKDDPKRYRHIDTMVNWLEKQGI